MCVIEEPHHKFLPREEENSPKITLEGLLTIMVIGAYEVVKMYGAIGGSVNVKTVVTN